MKDFQYERAIDLWKILVDIANKKELCTYKNVSSILNIHPRVIRYPLHIIQEYCIKNDLPPLTIIIVSSISGRQGKGIYASNPDQYSRKITEVYNFNWSIIDFDPMKKIKPN